MIYYNMRYRGAYEYDKFVLNTLQYSNMVNGLIDELEKDVDYENLKSIHQEINQLYNTYLEPKGLCEKVYKDLVLFKKEVR